MSKKIDLSVIILNYNTKDLLKDCLTSVIKSRLGKYQIETIVVDNASTDNSVEAIKKFKNIRAIQNSKNLGFAAGNNVAISSTKGRYLLFLNPDTKVFPETFKTMLDFMDKNPRVGAATCRVELPGGKLDYPCHRGFPTPWSAFAFFSGLANLFPKTKFLNGYTLAYLPMNETHEIDSASGSFLIVRRKVGEALGWWDEDYFWYGEDLDFCFRIKKAGWKIIFHPKTKIIHYRGVSSGILAHSRKITTASRETKKQAAKASTQAMRIFFQKHYRGKYPRPVLWLVLKGVGFLERIRLLKTSFL